MRNQTIKLEDAEIIFPNFSGEAGLYNTAGTRKFNVVLEDPALLKKLEEEGWNIKTREGYEEGDPETHYFEVKVNLDSMRPPVIYAVRGGRKIGLDKSTIGMLDNLPIATADLVLNPYPWKVQGNTGIKPYLVKGYFVIDEDEIDAKYADMEEVFCPIRED